MITMVIQFNMQYIVDSKDLSQKDNQVLFLIIQNRPEILKMSPFRVDGNISETH